ncbi:hypothetical protein [Streptomyces sp. NBC_01508]|uniref:hypothetical protein n=1 Tax=Streptomyces sp. NBC_01508 TaxID=2903888 RepID=UPI003868C395
MDDRWSGTAGTGGTGQPPGPGNGHGPPPPGNGPPPGYGPPGFGPPAPFAPPPATARASRRHLGAYVTSGILLLVFACVLGAWIIDTAVAVRPDPGVLLESLVKDDGGRPLLVLTVHEWAFAVALLVVGIAALALRTTARGAALLLAFLLLGAGARQLNGLTRSDYRDHMFATEHGGLIVLTYVFAFLAAATVIILLLTARERDIPPEPMTGGRRAAGVLLILIGAVQGFWYVHYLREYNEAIGPDGGPGAFTEWWHEALNVNARGGYGASVGYTHYHSALMAAFLVVGVLLLRNAPAARGAALALLGVAAYLRLRELAGVPYEHLSDYYRNTTFAWSLNSAFAAGAAMLVAIALLLRTPRPYATPQYPTAPLP